VWDVESKTSGVIFLFCGMPKVVAYINRSSRAAAGASRRVPRVCLGNDLTLIIDGRLPL
jgi:hypothetical protein